LCFSFISSICAFEHNHLVEPGVEGRGVTSHIAKTSTIEIVAKVIKVGEDTKEVLIGFVPKIIYSRLSPFDLLS
jgi:hypothetical protein